MSDPTLSERVKTLVDQALDAIERADSFSSEDAKRPVPNPPATLHAIAELEADLRERGISMPPSLRALLTHYDGVPEFMGPAEGLSLRSAREIVDAREDDEADWEELSPAASFVFMGGDSPAFVGFLPDSADDAGEMAVVHIDASGEETEYDGLVDYLESHLGYLNDVIESNEADRADLPDD